MSLDRRSWVRVAWVIGGLAAGGFGCRPAVPPADPLDEPAPPRDQPTVVAPRQEAGQGGVAAGPGRRILVGEMCPLGAAGRPAVAPLFLRGVQWNDEPTEVGNAIGRGDTGKFLVFGVDGKRAGLFDPVGPADVGLAQTVAAGSYAGDGPCTKLGPSGARLEEPACQAATKGCGLAAAILDDGAGSGGGGAAWKIGGACQSGDELAIDLDGDGKAESFPVASLLDGVRAPAELVETRAQAGSCTPSFTLFGLRVAPPPEPGKVADPRYLVLLDVLGVVDFDDDGKREVVVGLRYPDSRTIAVYSGVEGGMKLVGEATSWAK